jgi:hypothetical protein
MPCLADSTKDASSLLSCSRESMKIQVKSKCLFPSLMPPALRCFTSSMPGRDKLLLCPAPLDSAKLCDFLQVTPPFFSSLWKDYVGRELFVLMSLFLKLISQTLSAYLPLPSLSSSQLYIPVCWQQYPGSGNNYFLICFSNTDFF